MCHNFTYIPLLLTDQGQRVTPFLRHTTGAHASHTVPTHRYLVQHHEGMKAAVGSRVGGVGGTRQLPGRGAPRVVCCPSVLPACLPADGCGCCHSLPVSQNTLQLHPVFHFFLSSPFPSSISMYMRLRFLLRKSICFSVRFITTVRRPLQS